MNQIGNNSNIHNGRKKGFALILTLALISFVFLLIITLVSQVRTELSFTESRQNQILAKAHARMGMMIAIGEIQKHLGPDMRVSASADIYDERIDSGKKYYDFSVPEEYGFYAGNRDETFLHISRAKYPLDDEIVASKYPSNNLESVDLYRNEETYPYPNNNTQVKRLPLGQRQWTGVWKHRGHGSSNYLADDGFPLLATRDLPFNGDKGSFVSDSWAVDTSYDHHPAVEQAWLVSGNEGWHRKLGILNKTKQIKDFIEVPDGKYIDDEGRRVIPGSPGGNYGQFENPWLDHEKVVLELNKSGNYIHPLVALPDPAGHDNNFQGSEKTTWLLKNPLLNDRYEPQNLAHQSKWKDYLVAEPVKVLKTPIIPVQKSQKYLDDYDWEERTGSYAFWVGDEGIKAKINIMKPHIIEDGKIKFLLDENSQLTVASEPNLQSGSFGFDFNHGGQADHFHRKDLITPSSIKDLIYENKDEESALSYTKYFYHSLTTDSFGVLADVKRGGLKRDLSLAFTEDSKSALWKKDFNYNWIYRDRVEALKNFPIYPEQSKEEFETSKIHKNQWFDNASDATVDDPDAMLAGPLWSVLADFHKLSGSNAELNITAPSQFPRIVGDNALIFNPGEPPHSPKKNPKWFEMVANARGGKVSKNDVALQFFNTFSDKYGNSMRPEPSNHAITPILTGLKMSFNPVIYDSSENEVAIAINTAVTLWNPYNKPLRVKNLHAYIPFKTAQLRIFKFDLREYDLFRKWWMFVSKPIQKVKVDPVTKAKGKDPSEPWPLYSYYTGEMRAEKPVILKGIFDSFLNPDSKLRYTGSRLTNGFHFKHQFPRDPEDWWMSNFKFKSLEQKIINLKSFGVNLFNNSPEHLGEGGQEGVTLIQPGEVVSFTNDESVSGDLSEFLHFKLEARGSENGAFLGRTGVKDFKFGAVAISFDGFSGINASSSDNFVVDGTEFKYFADKKPDCLSLIYWPDENSLKKDSQLAKFLYALPLDLSQRGFHGLNELRIYTKGILSKNWSNRNSEELDHDNLPGLGWNFNLLLPGDRKNERIVLNDFNVRHFVQSEQHGMGLWMQNRGINMYIHGLESKIGLWTESLKHLKFDVNRTNYSVYHPNFQKSDLTVDYNYTNTFTTLDSHTLTVGGTGFKHALGMRDLTFPDFYDLPTNFHEQDSWNKDISVDLNDSLSTDEFAGVLFRGNKDYFDTTSIISEEDYPDSLLKTFYQDSDYIPEDLRNALVPKWNHSDARTGFFRNDKDFKNAGSPKILTSDKKAEENLADDNAVLFEIPDGKPLSILQYRHANLNSYLHGPSYALGNSYASTQVARHRSWGRVQTIEYVPTRKRGLTTSMMREMEEKQNLWVDDYYNKFLPDKEEDKWEKAFHNWGSQGGEAFMGQLGEEHDIDFNRGFAFWRKTGSGIENNHQNTTIDHSYYLNRALLDSFFLSGVSDNKKPASLTSVPIGQYYSPFLYYKDDAKVGNHRLVGFFREGDWKETSYENLKKNLNTSANDDFRYQSVAGDLLVNGAFNINSTSVDAWIAQLSSLRGAEIKRNFQTNAALVNTENITPVMRFIEQPGEENSWNQFRKLSDKEIAKLAKAVVKHIKLAGPFLCFSDFVNRRLAPGPQNPSKAKGTGQNFVTVELSEWGGYPESRYTVTGLRGPLQTAIAEAGLNDSPEHGLVAGMIPKIPGERWDEEKKSLNAFSFGLHASSLQDRLWYNGNERYWGKGSTQPGFGRDDLPDWTQKEGVMKDFYNVSTTVQKGGTLPSVPNWADETGGYRFRPDKIAYDTTEYGEAPENFLAVEHLATGANKPGWTMQSDLLSPLAPVTSARSDTFSIRVMGETGKSKTKKAWIELVVQRTPDYVKSDLDAPHHRPHEPFKDKNFNGYWDNGYNEEWIDLNRNGDSKNYPDMPGEEEAKYRDGMPSDLRLEIDSQEEDTDSTLGVSFLGINQRFGRKFKIVRFRWLRAQDV